MVHTLETSNTAKKSKQSEVSASDIRQRYRAEVGFRTQNPNTSASVKLPNIKPKETLEVSKEDENKLFHVSLNSLALKGNFLSILGSSKGDSCTPQFWTKT